MAAEPMSQNQQKTNTLSVRDCMVLAIAGQQWMYQAVRDTAVRQRLGMSPVEFHMRTNKLIDTPAAEAYDAVLVHRLRRLREARQRARGARAVGF